MCINHVSHQYVNLLSFCGICQGFLFLDTPVVLLHHENWTLAHLQPSDKNNNMSMVIHKFQQTPMGKKCCPRNLILSCLLTLILFLPNRLLFIFRTQMKIFYNVTDFWHSTNSPHNYHFKGPENVVNTLLKWIKRPQWFHVNFYEATWVLCAKYNSPRHVHKKTLACVFCCHENCCKNAFGDNACQNFHFWVNSYKTSFIQTCLGDSADVSSVLCLLLGSTVDALELLIE